MKLIVGVDDKDTKNNAHTEMLKHLDQIVPRPTSHGVGLKRVLLSGDETETAVTQIAVTRLAEGEVAAEHRHESMEEYFYFLKGEAMVCVDGWELLCREGDFLQVECGRSHSVLAKSDVEMLTVGVAYASPENPPLRR